MYEMRMRQTLTSHLWSKDKFEQFEMTTDLKHTTPREARLGRWVLLYGVLQVLSTLTVDVHGLKHKDGARYFLCTDLKRCPEWVVNGQIEYLEASQKRSWCWQRTWDPAPTQTAPVELEATATNPTTNPPPAPVNNELSAMRPDRDCEREDDQPPPLDLNNASLEGATLVQNDIRRINEKINDLSLTHNATQHFTQEYEQRRENEKSLHADFDWKPRYDSLPNAPHPTPASLARTPNLQPRALNPNASRNPNTFATPNFPQRDFDFSLAPAHLRTRSPPTQGRDTLNTDLGGYPFSPEELQWPVPPGYSEADHARNTAGLNHRESGIGYEVGASVYGDGEYSGRDLREGVGGDGGRRRRGGGGWN